MSVAAFTPDPAIGETSGPSITSATRASTAPSRAKIPQVSKLGANGMQLSIEIAPQVGRNPQTPQNAAGARTDPPVSVPSAKSTRPPATAAAEPQDDPPVIR